MDVYIRPINNPTLMTTAIRNQDKLAIMFEALAKSPKERMVDFRRKLAKSPKGRMVDFRRKLANSQRESTIQQSGDLATTIEPDKSLVKIDDFINGLEKAQLVPLYLTPIEIRALWGALQEYDLTQSDRVFTDGDEYLDNEGFSVFLYSLSAAVTWDIQKIKESQFWPGKTDTQWKKTWFDLEKRNNLLYSIFLNFLFGHFFRKEVPSYPLLVTNERLSLIHDGTLQQPDTLVPETMRGVITLQRLVAQIFSKLKKINEFTTVRALFACLGKSGLIPTYMRTRLFQKIIRRLQLIYGPNTPFPKHQTETPVFENIKNLDEEGVVFMLDGLASGFQWDETILSRMLTSIGDTTQNRQKLKLCFLIQWIYVVWIEGKARPTVSPSKCFNESKSDEEVPHPLLPLSIVPSAMEEMEGATLENYKGMDKEQFQEESHVLTNQLLARERQVETSTRRLPLPRVRPGPPPRAPPKPQPTAEPRPEPTPPRAQQSSTHPPPQPRRQGRVPCPVCEQHFKLFIHCSIACFAKTV